LQDSQRETATGHLTFSRWIAGILLRWKIVVGITAATILAALAAIILMPPVYRANASFIANPSGSAARGRIQGAIGSNPGIGGLLDQLGAGAGGDPSESPIFYLQLLQSRELLTRLVQSRFPNPRTDAPNDSATLVDILKIRKKDPQLRVELAVRRMVREIRPGFDIKTNFVWFSVDSHWPDLSAQIANRVIGLVSSFNRETRVSRAKSKRLFVQGRLDSARAELRSAEERQRFFYDENRGLITSPSLRFDEQRIRREVDLASALYLSLQGQLEVARLEEFNDASLITVIDSAVAPRKPRWPEYGAVLVTASAFGLLAGILIAGSAVVLADWRRKNPEAWADFESTATRVGSDMRGAVGLPPRKGGNGQYPEQAEKPVMRSHDPVV